MSHPGVEAIRGFLADSGLMAATIPEQRAAMAAMVTNEPVEGVTVEAVTLGGRAGERLVPDRADPGPVADADPDPTVLYLHGGGYCIGTLDTHRALGARIARAAGCVVTTLDYRLAPEDPFPAAVDDAVAAYRDLLGLGVPSGRLAIAGDSAGGGLTLATLLALRAAGLPLPAAAVCLSPWVDLTQSSAAYQRMADLDPMVTGSGLDLMAGYYLGTADPRTELASPLFAADLAGLPPVRIEVGEHEVLLDDATAMAERLGAAGVPVTLIMWPELIHVFQAFPGSLLPEADESIAGVGAFLAEQLGATAPGRADRA